MKKYIFTAALTVLAAAACSKENIENQKQVDEVRGIEVSANVSEATRTTIDGVNVLWSKGDKVGFIADVESVVAVDSFHAIKDEFDGQQSAKITVPVKADAVVTDETEIAFTAYYPYSAKTTEGGRPVAEIATEQDGQTGEWGYMSAKFSGTVASLAENGLTFEHSCAYIDFQLKSSAHKGCPVTEVKLISLDGRFLTGEYGLTGEGALTDEEIGTRINYVSLIDPVESLSGEWQGKVAVVVPVDLTGTKVKVEITYTENGADCTQSKIIDGSNLAAGHKVTLKLNLDKTDFNVIEFEDETLGKLLATAFGSDGYLTMAQAAAVTDESLVVNALTKNMSISTFHEFQYFTGLRKTPNFSTNSIKIGKITLPHSITTINDYSFRQTNISEINNTYGVTYIGSYAFQNATSLKSIDLSLVTSIARYAFNGTSGLESVGDTDNLINVDSYAFAGSGIKSIDLSNVSRAGDYSFSKCGNLESVDLRSLKSAGNYMFQGCAKLTSVGSLRGLSKIPDYMFLNCLSLPSVDYLTENVGNYAFQNCYQLEISNEQLKVVKTIGQGGFDNCKKIAGEISLPVIESIGSSAFSNSGITAIDLTGAPIKEIGSYAFTRMNALKKITISANVSKICANVFQYNNNNLSEIHLLSTTPATLDAGAFASISDDYIIYVPKGYVETYKAEWADYADHIQEERQ